MGCIYKITSPSGKVYIGQTVKTLHERIKGHKKSSTNCTLLKRAIDKYGDEMKYEHIEEIPDEILDEREIYWIREYNSLAPNGYNCSSGGNNKKKLSQTLKTHISKGMSNYTLHKNGYLGSVLMRGNTYVPRIKINNKTIYLSNGSFKTKEEVINVLKEYTKDPENFVKPLGSNKRTVGCVHASRNKWYVQYKHKHLGTFRTKHEAETFLNVYLQI